jgi:hypothetical protein
LIVLLQQLCDLKNDSTYDKFKATLNCEPKSDDLIELQFGTKSWPNLNPNPVHKLREAHSVY